MNSQEVISLYEAISDISGQMLAAARSGDWKRLTELESRCSGHVDALARGEPHMALPSLDRDRKVKIIRKILENDREIRTITEPWMTQLSMLTNSSGAERKLSKAYSANQPG